MSKLGGEFMPPLDEAICCTCPLPCPASHRQGGATAATDRPPDQDRAGSAKPSLEKAAGRVRNRPGADGNVRDYDPVQAARSVANRHDDRQAGRRAGPHLKVPGLSNIWVPPIRNRIDMLATGIKSPVGIKVRDEFAGNRPHYGRNRTSRQGRPRIVRAGRALEWRALYRRPYRPRGRGTLRNEHCRCAKHRLCAIGGDNIGETVEGLQRYRSMCVTRVRYAIRWKSCAHCRS